MTPKFENFSRRLIGMIINGEIRNRRQFQSNKIKLCKEFSLDTVPPNSEILRYTESDEKKRVVPYLLKKPIRTMSGVAVIAVMTSPYPCPHGKCTYCPGGVDNSSPQSYTGKEPAARRASRNSFDPYKQVSERILQLEAIGHITDKIDLIVMGGTFTSREEKYQTWFIKRCFDALNGCDSPDIDTAHKWNETAKHRCVGITIETRPDIFDDTQIEIALRLGVTRVEFGVQILDDEILRLVGRGHGISEVIEATKRCKDHGLGVCYHLMPGLPKSSPKHDLECFKEVFNNDNFRPDMLKFYTTLVIAGTELYKIWNAGKYIPYNVEDAVTLLADMKALVPDYVRIQRVQRDIPAPQIAAGILKSNIRQLIHEKLKETGRKCRCIRCREVGHNNDPPDDLSSIKMHDLIYRASNKEEHFINLSCCDQLIGYLRLRLDSQIWSTIRELKVFGKSAEIGSYGENWQHQGFGKKLVAKAERITIESGRSRIRVISGIGARENYKALGYSLDGVYMIKNLQQSRQ
ncbi:MAG: tRNA uridine(34) 5-carboxymethylaminomethyl modification radical SAM/GNAT enzyme Elp3 [archaeon]|nr:tRNA uridine(34) 5-carboxymethylaminomethyl modification radical SAM/GNAT enzyme Elp3 [archaeon]